MKTKTLWIITLIILFITGYIIGSLVISTILHLPTIDNAPTNDTRTREQITRDSYYYYCVKIASVETSKNISDCNLIK